ncbi:hypothetical protein QR680_007600 [Steinernema hermaphroditum]|uniref:Large ribosomal subunit protein mL64 n=1 Tax=Steinernema hermaphroditum TaxID=289476 RepID=A0AA39IG45_9BILA|nr:hypothetical protein QR680_007600 [Steinernema hermaphroditum]
MLSRRVLTSRRALATKPASNTLREKHRILAEGGIPPVTYDYEKERSELAARFGRFGMKSGVDIRKLWPTVEEIEQEQALKLYRTYDDVASAVSKEEEAQRVAQVKRDAEVAKKEQRYPEMLKKYEASLVKAEEEKSEKEKETERRIREIQEYFGYWMDPKDPRFEVMLEQKEAEEKKAAKLAKRQELLKKKIAAVSGSS